MTQSNAAAERSAHVVRERERGEDEPDPHGPDGSHPIVQLPDGRWMCRAVWRLMQKIEGGADG
ncbi:hypothetical protein EOD42_20370 [Rhodovarius crocodyli]|uniref:Uncharacterized protein n=1 Tax=Rhodovarius crocodyli TaxID=1979269 RepID=A0A437M2F3_9PROT|nr:hypothetical protein [Rhodovarius crocodyli]RVT91684.1 hypothetical protein EOD42_20370 [Rhodovarius crocodyli]